MNETCRAGDSDDAGSILELLREGRALIADERGAALWLARDAIAEPLDRAIAAALSDNDYMLQLCFIDDVPLGVLVAQREKIDGVSIAVVRELYVTPDARGVGLGEMMIDATFEWATTAGCVGVDGYALPGDRATKNFFERFGLKARGIVVHRGIDR